MTKQEWIDLEFGTDAAYDKWVADASHALDVVNDVYVMPLMNDVCPDISRNGKHEVYVRSNGTMICARCGQTILFDEE